MDPLIVEGALAAVGLEPLLRGDPPRFGVTRREQAMGLADRARRHISAFLRQAETPTAAALPAFDFDEVRDLLNGAGTADQLEALHLAFDNPAMADAVKEKATAIIQGLQAIQPKLDRETLIGREPVRPTAQEEMRFRRAWEIACDPDIAFRDLEEMSLTTSQVEALSQFWPALYKTLKPTVIESITSLKAQRPAWEVPREKDQQLRLLLGIPPIDNGLGAAIQQSYQAAQAQKQPQPPRPSGNLGENQLATAGQIAEMPKAG